VLNAFGQFAQTRFTGRYLRCHAALVDIKAVMYRATTRKIEVTVTPRFIEERSSPANSEYFWSYTIEIANVGDRVVQLTHRHWQITDANGGREEVRGPGVVGEQPKLRPGDAFTYTSGCPLRTPSGIMVGTYRMVDESGEAFDVEIPAFSLDSPYAKRMLN
jgi:ApaG protein